MTAVEQVFRHGAVERGEEWRRGFEAGRKSGAASVLNSTALADIALELRLTRIVVDGLERAVRERDDRIEWLEGVIEFISPRKTA